MVAATPLLLCSGSIRYERKFDQAVAEKEEIAVRRCSTLFDAVRRCSTLFDAVRRCSTLFDAVRRCSTLFDAPHYP
jgi:hypothetical protein